MRGMYKPGKGQKPGFVVIHLKSWEHANSIVLMDGGDGPSFSGMIEHIKERRSCGSEYRVEEQSDGSVVLLIQCPGNPSRLNINYPRSNEHADVVWIQRQYTNLDTIHKQLKN